MAKQNENNTEQETGIEHETGNEPETPTTEMVRLADIDFDLAAQARTEPIDDKTVQRYVDDMKNGAEFPAIELVRDANGRLYCADGFHRRAAYRRLGRTEVRARIRPGTLAEARLRNGIANLSHGLPMSTADRRRQAAWLLSVPEYAARSDRWIAEACGVSPTTIGNLRAARQKYPAGPDGADEPEYRVGADGKKRRVRARTREENLAVFADPAEDVWQDSAGAIRLNPDKPEEWIAAESTRVLGFAEAVRQFFPADESGESGRILSLSADEQAEIINAVLVAADALVTATAGLRRYAELRGLLSQPESEAEAEYKQAL